MIKRLTRFSVEYPKTTIIIALVITIIFAIQFPRIHIDTDPENMLESGQSDRVFYDSVKEEFGIHDLIVLGITDERGIYRAEFLERLSDITSEILTIKGVIIEDVISLATTNNVTSESGILNIQPPIEEIPGSQEDLEKLTSNVTSNPLLYEKLVSTDGEATAIYIPIEKKDISYRVSLEIEEIVENRLDQGQTYHIAGLPVAEDTFGNEMFWQMGVTAPLTGIAIMILLLLLFRRWIFLMPPMIVAMFSTIWAMGLLIGFGFTVHIMSSMIPIFLMPIAVLDSIHILSEIFDIYPSVRDKKKAILKSVDELFKPMLLTSVTSAVGFASLMLADIPPVRVFGLFVAFGIIVAWILTLTVIPASLMLVSDKRLAKIKAVKEEGGIINRVLRPVGRFSFAWSRLVIIAAAALLVLAVVGITRIEINDNPVKWFKEKHRLRVADRVMNEKFGGTYMAYVVAGGDDYEYFKEPEALSYLDQLQQHLETDELVGKTSSVVNILKRINFVLHDNDESFDILPETSDAVSQFLFLYQSMGEADDILDFLNHESDKANIWVQLKSGDNKQMERIEKKLEEFIQKNPLPAGFTLRWSGLTYINKVWQDLMVFGMLKAVLGSFLVVFLLMIVEFRSFILGFLSMIPLSFSITASYGALGWIGKEYDMPVAVCSALSLGLAIDFAIHHITRYRARFQETGDLEEANRYVFGAPGRAIFRNSIVISLGFLPLFLSTLTPYATVGGFFASLMIFSTLSTLILLPAMIRQLGKFALVKSDAEITYERRKTRMILERILRGITGIFVLVTVVLGYFHSPLWFVLTIFVGLNLFQSAFSNWCPMMSFLKMFGIKSCDDQIALLEKLEEKKEESV
jgi:predicted RND superfamily exporter protein